MTKNEEIKIADVMGQIEELLENGKNNVFLLIKPKKKRGKEAAPLVPVIVTEFHPNLGHIMVNSLEKSKKRMSISTNTGVSLAVSPFITRPF